MLDAERIIVALDFPDKSSVENFIGKFSDKSTLKFVKVGMELYYAEGPEIVKYLKSLGLKVFLDLKIHDIPNTAYGAVSSVAKLGADIINVHAQGSIAMMSAAKKALVDSGSNSKLIAVTQLTSIDGATLNQELNVPLSSEDYVNNLALNTKNAGLDGIVCSALEAKSIKVNLGKDFMTVCPGIRPKLLNQAADLHDQKRVMSPEEALDNGADYIVMGRAITNSASPEEVLRNILKN